MLLIWRDALAKPHYSLTWYPARETCAGNNVEPGLVDHERIRPRPQRRYDGAADISYTNKSFFLRLGDYIHVSAKTSLIHVSNTPHSVTLRRRRLGNRLGFAVRKVRG